MPPKTRALGKSALLRQPSSVLNASWHRAFVEEDDCIIELAPFKGKPCLPTKEEALLLYYFCRNSERMKRFKKETIAQYVVGEVTKLWKMANIPTKTNINMECGLLKMVSRRDKLIKNLGRKGSKEKEKREAFAKDLKRLWDVASQQAEELLKKDRLIGAKARNEDLDFLRDQRGPRKASIGAADAEYADTVSRKMYRTQGEEERKKKESERKRQASLPKCQGGLNADDEFGENQAEYERDEDFQPRAKTRKSDTVTVEVPKKIFDDSNVVAMLDRTKVSSRTALCVVAAVLKTANADLNDFSTSQSTLRRTRDRQREATAAAVMQDFIAHVPRACALHWDGKLVGNVVGTKDERLAVLVSGSPDLIEGKLLAIPTLSDENGKATSSGLAQAEATQELIEELGLKDNLAALVFDTTGSNTGCHRGAATRLRQWLGNPLLMLGCRHHIGELIAKAVWHALFEEDLSPENRLFHEFKQRWAELDTSAEVPVKRLDQTIRSRTLAELKDSAIDALNASLKQKSRAGALPRDDYREVAEVCLALLGEIPPRGRVTWLKPGATHKARFLNFSIFACKRYLFSDQIGYDKDTVASLQRVANFLCLIYVPYYLQAGHGADATVNDLKLYHQLFFYR